MNSVKATTSLGSADPTMDEVLHRGRQGSSRLGLFWGNFVFLFFFWRKYLIWSHEAEPETIYRHATSLTLADVS